MHSEGRGVQVSTVCAFFFFKEFKNLLYPKENESDGFLSGQCSPTEARSDMYMRLPEKESVVQAEAP